MGKTFSTGLLTNGLWQDASNNIGIGGSPSGSYKFEVTGTGRFTSNVILNNLGIGGQTIRSSSALKVIESNNWVIEDNGDFGFKSNAYFNGTNNVYINTGLATRLYAGNGAFEFYTAPSGTAGATTTFTSRFFIGNTGNVGIGTSSPSYKLDIMGNTSSSSDVTMIRLWNNTGENCGSINFDNVFGPLAQITGTKVSGGSGADDGILYFSTAQNSALSEKWRITNGGILASNGNSTEASGGPDKFSIGYSNGNYGWLQSWGGTNIYINRLGNAVYAGTQRIDNNSDQRLKENITSVENALDIVLKLQGRKFNMIDENGKLRYGFVAQEVQPHLSDFVTESVRSYEKDDIKIENLLTLESSGAAWAAILIEAIKELSAKVSALENKS
jgi:hypothetical protein